MKQTDIKIERLDDDKVRVTQTVIRELSNQELYNEFGSMKIQLTQLRQQHINAIDTVTHTKHNIEILEASIANIEQYAREAEKYLDREKQIQEADENGA